MKRVKITAFMVEKETGGYVSAISKSGDYSEQEFKDKKYLELIEGIEVLENCEWDYMLEWY
jgi:hypothetical protein